MRFYRVVYFIDGGNSAGYSWHLSKREAERRARLAREADPVEYAENRSGPPRIEAVDVKLNKSGVLDLLISYASHPDNG